MGGGNVAAVFAVWSPILGDKHRDMRALLFMANTALDGDAPPRYFGGWEALACALGFDVEGNPDSAERNTKKALSALVKVGAITSSGTARAGVRAEYALNLVPGHTHVPSGSGRNVTWTQQQRSDGANQGDCQGYPGVTTRGTQRGTARGTQQGDRQGSGSGTARGTPRRTQDPPRGAPEEEREEPVITSQRNPSTRGGASATGLIDLDEPMTQQDRKNAATAALRAKYPDAFPPL